MLIRAKHLSNVGLGGAVRRALAIGLSCVLLLGAVPSASSAEHADIRDKLLNLGAGPLGGGSRPVGEALCDAVNAERRTTHVRCVAVGTAGSTFNLESVMSGRLLMGLAQEDRVHQIRQDPKRPGAQALRVVAVTHESPIAVMVGPQSGITELGQLAGKRVNLGSQGSDQFTVTQALLAALDLRVDQLAAATYLPASALEPSLCGNEVDVVVKAVAHPSPLFQRLLACGCRFIEIPPEVVTRMRAGNRWLVPMSIAANSYDGQSQPVASVGTRNVLVARSSVDTETVFRLARTLRHHHAELRREHPMLASMPRPETILPDSLPAPLHEGAARAYGLPRTP
jgi:TRAP transporter TAXI family solute receptor